MTKCTQVEVQNLALFATVVTGVYFFSWTQCTSFLTYHVEKMHTDKKDSPLWPHTHSVLTAIFPGEPGLAGCPLNSPSPFIPGLHILLA